MPPPISIRLKSDTMTPYLKRLVSSLNTQGQRTVTRAMAKAFWEITRANIGPNGVDRPKPWPPLSESYKKKLREKSFGTPLIPTLLRAGTLLNSIRIISESNYAIVFSDCPYAAAHQYGYGPKRLPARPYFPVIGQTGNLTPYADGKVMAAALGAISGIVNGS